MKRYFAYTKKDHSPKDVCAAIAAAGGVDSLVLARTRTIYFKAPAELIPTIEALSGVERVREEGTMSALPKGSS